MVGSLAGRDLGDRRAGAAVPAGRAGAGALAARGLDALALGDDVARGLGHRVGLVRLGGGAGAVLLTGAAVAAAGPIAFVGLAVPHLARALVGAGPPLGARRVARCSARRCCWSRTSLGRVVAPPGEVPAGIITALRRRAVPGRPGAPGQGW